MNVLIGDLPVEVHAALQRRTEHRGQSLQQCLSGELTRLAQRPTLEDVFDGSTAAAEVASGSRTAPPMARGQLTARRFKGAIDDL
jgi:hypothetical protein